MLIGVEFRPGSRLYTYRCDINDVEVYDLVVVPVEPSDLNPFGYNLGRVIKLDQPKPDWLDNDKIKVTTQLVKTDKARF